MTFAGEPRYNLPFTGIATFLRAPICSDLNTLDAEIAVLGIPFDEQARIFEKFHRLDPDMTRGVGGSGLGLYICKGLVERMDGEIWVESRPGRGSTFVFELPLAAA